MLLNDVFPKKMFYQGDTFSVNVSLLDYNSGDWTLKYIFKKNGIEPITVDSVSNSDGTFTISIDSTVTASFASGLYYVTAKVIKGAEVYTLGQTEIQVRADISQVSNYDPRSQNRIALDAIEQALVDGAGSDLVEYTIGGETYKKDRKGLLELRAFYLKRVRQEEGKSAIGSIEFYL